MRQTDNSSFTPFKQAQGSMDGEVRSESKEKREVDSMIETLNLRRKTTVTKCNDGRRYGGPRQMFNPGIMAC